MKHPKFRVRSILDLHESVIDELVEIGNKITKLFPPELTVTDVEIVGSYANGYADLHSDFDIAIPMKDWNEQIILRRLIHGENKNLVIAIKNIAYEFEEKYQVKLDVNPVIPDNKENKTYATYSLFERKLYNRPADLSKFYLAMSPYVQRYILKQYELDGVPVDTKKEVRVFSLPVKFSNDDYADEIAKWREIYGNKFIEYKILTDGQLSE